MNAKHRERLRAKLTRREDYSATAVYARVLTQRLHTVRRLKKWLAELDTDPGDR